MKSENTSPQKVSRAKVERALQRAGTHTTVLPLDQLLPPAPTTPRTKDQWIERVVVQHDISRSAMRRRDEAILRAVASGATCEEIAQALGPRLTAERVRQVLRAAGISPRAQRGRKKGQLARIPGTRTLKA